MEYLIFIHFVLAFCIGLAAQKFFHRNFFIWCIISLLIPVISIPLLFILGDEGAYCPHCNKKNKKTADFCKYCGFNLKEFLIKEEKRLKTFKESLKK